MTFGVVLLFSCLPAIAENAKLPPGDAFPEAILKVPPEYPKEFEKLRVRGEVVVEFIVEEDGTVNTAKIVRQTNERFGEAALASVKKWKFKPGTKDGVPVRCLMQVPILFETK